MKNLPIVVIGAGPIGLAAACRLLERGEKPIVIEKASEAGATILEWGHVRMFSSWAMNVDKSAVAMLEKAGWNMPTPEAFPTGEDLVRSYLAPLAELPEVAACIRYGHEVLSVTRWGMDKLKMPNRANVPFELHIRQACGDTLRILARAVIDATGTWSQPNPGGHSGVPAIGEPGHPRVAYGIPDVQGFEAERYRDKDTVVIGAGHSAINALLDLTELNAGRKGTVTWATRGQMPAIQSQSTAVDTLLPERSSGLARAVALVKRGVVQSAPGFTLEELRSTNGGRLLMSGLREGRRSILEADELIVCTGFRPDLTMLRELQLDLDSWVEATAGVGKLIRQAMESGQAIPQPYGAQALAHPETDLFVVGMKSHGRAPNFFLSYGYEQVRSVAAWLCGDMEAATRIEFQMPEGATCSGCGDGACCGSVGGAQSCGGGASGCCGPATQEVGAAPAPASSCCA